MPVTTFRFLRQFVTSPRSVGAIAPSSKGLAKRITDWIDWENVQAACEVGPGTGAFTQTILRRMRDDARFFMVELNGQFARQLTRRYPGVTVYLDSVEHLGGCCERERIDSLDAIISGLPWAAFPEDLQDRCLSAITECLKPGGQFVTFAYLHGLVLPAARRFRKKLDAHFASVERSSVKWLNLPPAVVYRCRAPLAPSPVQAVGQSLGSAA
jgi:phospholipid N-methyltransferase